MYTHTHTYNTYIKLSLYLYISHTVVAYCGSVPNRYGIGGNSLGLCKQAPWQH